MDTDPVVAAARQIGCVRELARWRGGYLNPTEQVPGLTNRPLAVHVHLQQDSRRSRKVCAAATAYKQEMALFVTLPMPVFTD